MWRNLQSFFEVSSQDRVQQRFRGQIIEIPAISLAEKIVERLVMQMREEIGEGCEHTSSTQLMWRSSKNIQENINHVTRHVEIPAETPLLQFTGKVVDIPVVA